MFKHLLGFTGLWPYVLVHELIVEGTLGVASYPMILRELLI